MKNDNVGLLSNMLLVLSDRTRELGTRDSHCIAIAELISRALDYPKTGILVRTAARFNQESTILWWSTMGIDIVVIRELTS